MRVASQDWTQHCQPRVYELQSVNTPLLQRILL